MHLEKVVRVLKAFDDKQLDRLEDFLASPYFKVTPAAGLLLKRLRPLHPRFPEKKLAPKVLGQKDQRINTDTKQSNAGSHLLRAIEKFLAQEQFEKKQDQKARLTIIGWQELGLVDEYEKAYEKQLKKIEADAEWTTDTFWEKHRLVEASFNHFHAKLKRAPAPTMMPIVTTLDEFYAIKKIRYLVEALHRHQFFGTPFTTTKSEIESLVHTLQPYCNDRYPYVFVFMNVFRMMEEQVYEDSNIYYQFLKQFVEKHKMSETIEEASFYAFDYCLRWYNKGYTNAAEEYLWWIEWRTANNLLYSQNKITPATFRNIIGAALYVRPPQWIEKSIQIHGPHLPDEYRETQIAFARGLHQYALKDFKKAIRYFLQAEAGEEVIFNGIIREWQTICLYEGDPYDTDALYNHLMSFEKYLQRNKKELRHHASSFERFIGYVFKLLKTVDEEKVGSTLIRLQNESYFFGKPWLLKQLVIKQKKPIHTVHGPFHEPN
jgi:hypothetical protein